MRLTKFLTKIMPVRIIKKANSFLLISSVAYYRKVLLKECKYCGEEVNVFKPISIKGLNYVSIGDNFKLDFYGILETYDRHNNETYKPVLKIGDNVSFGKNCHIGCINRVVIGDNVLGGSNILIIDHNHGNTDGNDLLLPPNLRKLFSPGGIEIGKNVWIGDKVTILPNVIIGDNAIIGANTVVTKNIPSNAVAVGNPAKIIKVCKEE